MRDRAMELSFEGERVNSLANIVDATKAFDRDDARLGIDLDLANEAAIRIGVWALMRAHAGQADPELAGHAIRHIGATGELAPADDAVGPGNSERAALI